MFNYVSLSGDDDMSEYGRATRTWGGEAVKPPRYSDNVVTGVAVPHLRKTTTMTTSTGRCGTRWLQKALSHTLRATLAVLFAFLIVGLYDASVACGSKDMSARIPGHYASHVSNNTGGTAATPANSTIAYDALHATVATHFASFFRTLGGATRLAVTVACMLAWCCCGRLVRNTLFVAVILRLLFTDLSTVVMHIATYLAMTYSEFHHDRDMLVVDVCTILPSIRAYYQA